MTHIGLICVLIGSLIIVTRGPLIFAPEGYRSFVLKLLASDASMRGFGIFTAALGGLLAWSTRGLASGLGQFLYTLGIIIIAMAALFMVPFPKASGNLARGIWNAFSTTALRALGVLAVVLGALLVSYGFSL